VAKVNPQGEVEWAIQKVLDEHGPMGKAELFDRCQEVNGRYWTSIHFNRGFKELTKAGLVLPDPAGWRSYDPARDGDDPPVVDRVAVVRDVRQAVWEKSDGRCWYCGVQTRPFDDFVVDHMVALALGGSNDIANLVPCCWRCNSRKGARRLAEFRLEFPDGFWFERTGRKP
jgi:hypothetical protein